MNDQIVDRLQSKSTLHTIQVELQDGYDLSPDESINCARSGSVIRSLSDCEK